jgi:prepilin-type N-terminal cleavage/methylation domain-containing protein
MQTTGVLTLWSDGNGRGRIMSTELPPSGRDSMMMKREDGFTLVELMITMVIFVLFITAATNVFTGLLTQFKQQSRLAETNIEGIVGLEIMRQDIEGAGYGLPWDGLITYTETADDPYSLNDASAGVPKAVVSANAAAFTSPNDIFDGSDYLVIKSMNVARNSASEKWTTLASESPYFRTWTTEGEATNPVSENLQDDDRVIVLSPGGSGNQRRLVSDGGAYSKKYSEITALPWRPNDPIETRIVYGVDPNSNLRMPFNRADYFIRRFDTSGNSIAPKRCAPNTGVLIKATVSHVDGTYIDLPLLDCVADMQVIYGLDSDADGDFEPTSGDVYSEDLTASTAETIRAQVKQVRVYILAHEGQRDSNYTYCPSSAASCSTAVPVGEFGLGSTFDLKTKVGDPEYKYYRWKLYTIVVTPNNLE